MLGKLDIGKYFRRKPTDTVTFEYTPRLDGDPDPGEVVWTWVPYEDRPTEGKDRPVVVIGRRRGVLIGVPLTSKPERRELQVKLGTGDWDSRHRVSYARIERMLEIDPARMRREGAIIDRARFDRVVDAVERYHSARRAD